MFVVNQLISYFVSNIKIMDNIILPKEEIYCSIQLWQNVAIRSSAFPTDLWREGSVYC